MIPLNDTEPNRYTSWPFMVMAIIIVNIFVAAYEAVIIKIGVYDYLAHVYSYSSIPSLILAQRGGGALSAITHMFLHTGLLHLGGNMFFLWAYGRRVEDVCGPWRFLIFYLLCGVVADIVFTAVHFTSDVPALGASGATSGIMGAYFILFPKGKIRCMILWFVPIFPTLRAYWLILYYLAVQFPPALDSLFNQTEHGVGYWAHLGGFFACVTIFFFLSPRPFHNYRNELPL